MESKAHPDASFPPVYAESADFRLQKVIGPSMRQVNFMACTPLDGDIIVAASLFEERAISLYSVRLAQIIGTLENRGSKSTVALLFHSTYPDVLLSADISGELRAWKWQTGTLLRSWKKLHSRLIYKVDVVSGDPDR